MTEGEKARAQAWQKIRFGGILAVIMLIALASNYAGHVDGRQDKINGCERAKVSAKANKRAWTYAERARRAAFEKDGKPIDGEAAHAYLLSVRDFTRLSMVDCNAAYPPPSVLPF